MADTIRIVRNEALQEGPSTVGMVRNSAFSTDAVWTGTARTAPGMISGWHHHGEHTTYGYIVTGQVRFDLDSPGKQAVEAGPGDFFEVPPHVVHRESNPGSSESLIVLVRIGTGPSVTNVSVEEAK